MSGWYAKVSDDMSTIPKCIIYYTKEYEDARVELTFEGDSIEKHAAKLPGLVEYRFNQLQEIEAILEFLNIKVQQIRSKKFRQYLEGYNRALSSRDAEKYVDGEPEVVDMMYIVNEFALVRNKYLGIAKGLDQKSWAVSNVIKLRCAGLDDARID